MVEEALGREAFGRLAPVLQRFHSLAGRHELHGWVDTAAPASLPARLPAWLLGLPLRADSGAIRFELDAQPQQERWTRHFPSSVMRSRLQLRGREVIEHFGPLRMVFALREQQGRFEMQLLRVQMLGLSCPRWLMPAIVAHETGDGDRLCFDIQAVLPMFGRVAHYRGHLVVPAAS